jgi:hypothetical protein
LIILSQNLTNFDFPIPSDSVFRINLAWVNDLEELKILLKKHEKHEIFLDLPIGRTKPPHNKYTFDDILPLLNSKNIKFFAISNVESPNDILTYLNKLPEHITIVPKIESPEGIDNIEKITQVLKGEKIVMLDHDDLFSKLIKNNEKPSKFKDYITKLLEYGNQNNIKVLRTIGVVFSEEERRTTQYLR